MFELRIRLALLVDNVFEIHQQVGQEFFGQCAPSVPEGIQTVDAAFHFMGAFANGLAIPAQLSFSQAGATTT